MLKLLVIGHMIINFSLSFRLELKKKTLRDKKLYNQMQNYEINHLNDLLSIESDISISDMSNP
jgi:hypothetical protein